MLQIMHICHVFYCGYAQANLKLNNRPIIGVLMQSTRGMHFKTRKPNYIAASYVKFLESSGARVVPIWNDLTEDETEKIFNSINGAVFPGGNNPLFQSGYGKVATKIFALARKAFDERNDYFPIMGICLGHELLAADVEGTENIRSHTNSQNITLTLKFSEGYKDSEMFGDIPADLEEFLTTVPSTANFHMWSVTVKSFMQSKKMKDFYKIVSTSVDRDGIEFVANMEAIHYPIFTAQWHPEKNSFEWDPVRNMSHVAKAIQITQYMSNFFVNKARLNQHKFESRNKEDDALIYNYSPVYTGTYTVFEQVYFFNANSSVHHQNRD